MKGEKTGVHECRPVTRRVRTAASSGLRDDLGTGKAYSTYYFIQIWRMIISRYLKKKSPKTSSPERCYFCNIVMSWAVSRNTHNDHVNHGITGGELSWEHCDSSWLELSTSGLLFWQLSSPSSWKQGEKDDIWVLVIQTSVYHSIQMHMHKMSVTFHLLHSCSSYNAGLIIKPERFPKKLLVNCYTSHRN